MAMTEGAIDVPASICPDSIQSVVTLGYDINPGDHYSYKLITDQVVVNDHSARLQTTLELRVLARDSRGNTRCMVKLSSDPVRDSSALHAGDGRKRRFAGYRSWVQEREYEAVLDALGRILASSVIVSDDLSAETSSEQGAATLSERVTQYTNAPPQEDRATPELMNFVIPTMSAMSTIAQGAVWNDTFTIGSRIQFALPIRLGQTTPPVIAKDSLFRTTQVDSVSIQDGRQQCYMSLKTERHNANGTRLVAFSTLQRDVPTGLVVALHEKAYRINDDDPILHYTATAVLVHKMSTTLPPTESRPLLPR